MESTQAIIDDLRRRGAERSDVEVKAAVGGTPKAVRETISAFANGAGGTIILGVTDDFQPVEIDAKAVRDGLATFAADAMDPPVRGDIDIDTIDGDHQVVRFDVPELDLSQKPCFVKAKGKYGGSYVRGADGDRQLTNYEIDRLLENRRQPHHDRQTVQDATLADLDPSLVGAYLRRMRDGRPKAFAGLTDEDMLRNIGIVVHDGDRLVPTLAGLLTFGRYPQQFFPQLFVSFVVVPGTIMGDPGPDGERFLDNRSFEGPIPELVADAVNAVARHLARASVMDGAARRERLEYPVEVIRELIVNALMHRDYSPQSLGTQVQVELYADRLVVRSPGGFYGRIDAADFGAPDVSSSRNELLAKLLADAALPGSGDMVAENRGSGIPTVMRALYRSGMAPPTFQADLRRVEVTVPQHALLTPSLLAWVNSLNQDGLTQAQIQALAVLRDGREVRNQTLQGWGIHPADATRDLTNLVQRGLAVKAGERRWSSYVLAPNLVPADVPSDAAPLTPRQRQIIALFTRDDELTAADIADVLPVGYGATIKDINQLIDLGLLTATAPVRSRHRAYRLAPTARQENR